MKTVFGGYGLLAMLVAIPASAGTLFYGGDASLISIQGLLNEQAFSQAGVYTPFVVGGSGWDVTGLFTNNEMSITAQSASWEIRSGVSVGNGGTLLASGTSTPTVTDTGLAVGLEIYQVAVTGLNIDLSPGTFWMSVVPVCLQAIAACTGSSYNAFTAGTNAIGTPEPLDQSFLNSTSFSVNFGNALDYGGAYHEFSSGVIGNTVPEPGSLELFGVGLLFLVVIRRWH